MILSNFRSWIWQNFHLSIVIAGPNGIVMETKQQRRQNITKRTTKRREKAKTKGQQGTEPNIKHRPAEGTILKSASALIIMRQVLVRAL